MSSSEADLGATLPGNARVIMSAAMPGPAEMTIHEVEGHRAEKTLGPEAELAFWARVRAKAQAKAKELLLEAQAQAEEIREQARREGLDQGLTEARNQCETHMADLAETLAGVLAGLEEERRKLWAVHREEFAQLLKLAVEKTLHAELSERRQEVLDGLLDQALDLLDTRGGFTVVVHPDDDQSVRTLLEAAQKVHPGLTGWRVKTDPGLGRGGVRLESRAGLVDNGLDTRFSQIAELLDKMSFSESEA